MSDSCCFVALFKTCQNTHSRKCGVQSLHMLLLQTLSHLEVKSRYNFRSGFSLYYQGKGLSVKLGETKSNITCSPWERNGLTASDKSSR